MSELQSHFLTFEKGLLLAKDMLNNDEWDEDLQKYAANLLEELKNKYQDEWDAAIPAGVSKDKNKVYHRAHRDHREKI